MDRGGVHSMNRGGVHSMGRSGVHSTEMGCTAQTGAGCTPRTEAGCTTRTEVGCTARTEGGCTAWTEAGCTACTEAGCTAQVTPGPGTCHPMLSQDRAAGATSTGSPGIGVGRLPTMDPASHRRQSRGGFTLRSAETVCIRSALIYHLGVPKQGEGGGTDGEDETQDCTFPSSFELFPLFFLKFSSPERSALLSELEVTTIFPDIGVIVFDESLV